MNEVLYEYERRCYFLIRLNFKMVSPLTAISLCIRISKVRGYCSMRILLEAFHVCKV